MSHHPEKKCGFFRCLAASGFGDGSAGCGAGINSSWEVAA
jgi:hypothetical protein